LNPEKILIDTSAWIVSFKKAGNLQLKDFMKKSIINGLAATSPIIILELLQGCRTIKERDALKTRLESLELLLITHSVWEHAYQLSFSLRRKGLTIPNADLIIAVVAIENNSLLLHHDEHYEMIGRYSPQLQTKHFLPLT